MAAPALQITNRRRGGLLGLLARLSLLLLATAPAVAAAAALGLYAWFSRDLPEPPALETFQPTRGSHLYAHDGRLLGRLAVEQQQPVPLERMPPHLIQAFIAAEDKRFLSHRGVDLQATIRATLANLAADRAAQGASSLTQQLCKPLVGRQKSYERKIREAILARRAEARLSKAEILYLYLNQIYLGAGAYGVQAAARTYFDRDVGDLSLAQASLLAGLPPQPGRVNPVLDLEASRARQAYVLERMVADGYLDPAAAAAARDAPLELVPPRPPTLDAHAPVYAEHARRAAQARYGEDAVYRSGLEIHLAVDADLQTAARAALQRGLEALGERQGFTGPLARLEGPRQAPFLAAAEAAYAGPPALGAHRPWLALITAVDARGAEARVGGLTVHLPLASGLDWARPFDPKARHNRGQLEDPRAVLSPGDVVWVRPLPQAPPAPTGKRKRKRKAPPPPPPSAHPLARLAQPPPVEGALVALDQRTGRVVAMIGGYDFDRSEYNRAFQGCRQPGSAFKPLVYSLALSRGYTLATPLADTPITVYDQGATFLWKPRNFGGRFEGEVLLHAAFARSLNLPAIRTLLYVGAEEAARFAQRLGIRTPLTASPALVLGSSCVYPWDLVQAFATFAARGRAPRAHFVTRILDGRGRILEDRTHPEDPWAPTALRLDGLLRAALEPRPALLSEETGYLMQTALKAVVDAGTATDARALGRPAGGKTGTTDAFDAWFVGFTDQLVAGIWIGSDRNRRRLGQGETGGKVALPPWLELMAFAHEGLPVTDFTADPPEGIGFVAIDPVSGLLAAPGGRALRLPFKRGTEPTDTAQPAGRFGSGDVDMVEGRF